MSEKKGQRGIDKHIDRLKGQLASLKQRARAKQGELYTAELMRAKKDYGIDVGTIVLRYGKEYRVCEIRPEGLGKPLVKGCPRLKSGEFSRAVRHLYGQWTLPTSAPAKGGER